MVKKIEVFFVFLRKLTREKLEHLLIATMHSVLLLLREKERERKKEKALTSG